MPTLKQIFNVIEAEAARYEQTSALSKFKKTLYEIYAGRCKSEASLDDLKDLVRSQLELAEKSLGFRKI